jgi:hypothetical protein
MTGVRFAITDWAASAPGLQAPSDWQAWARAPRRPEGELEARLEAMPAMQRRRLNALGRAAAQVAWDCHAPDAGTPVVFASGYGDARRCLQLLKEFAATGAASPTDFTFSVHNAIGAMYSISRSDRASYTSVAAGPASAAAGVVEACALLADGAPSVLLVCYDAPLPDEYAAFGRDAPAPYAWAWRIAPARAGEAHFGLEWAADKGDEEAAGELPFGLQALQFTLSDAQRHSTRGWTWSRHA